MGTISDLRREFSNLRPPEPPFDGGGGGGDNHRMEARISALETANLDTRDRLMRIETRVEALASKEDLHRETHTQTWRIIGVAALLVAVVYYLAKYVH